MTWFDVDGARAYLAQHGGTLPPRKAIYAMAKAGMRYAPMFGDAKKGARMVFAAEWIDEFLVKQAEKRNAEAGKASASSRTDGSGNGQPDYSARV